jgi:hypothetical protein
VPASEAKAATAKANKTNPVIMLKKSS